MNYVLACFAPLSYPAEQDGFSSAIVVSPDLEFRL